MNVPLAVVFLSLWGALPALAQAGTALSSQEIDLAAPSDLTWTDPRDISAVLVIPAPMEGDFLVLDEEGHRVVQLLKRPGQPLALGFAPGRYRVLRQQDRQTSQARFTLREGRRLELTPWSFVWGLRVAGPPAGRCVAGKPLHPLVRR